MNDENEDDYEHDYDYENEYEDEDDGWKGLRNLPRLIDDYLAHIFAADPIEATRLGVHDHDDRLGDVSPAAIAEAAARRADFLDRLRQVDRAGLDADAAMDLDVALVDAETAVRRHEDVQAWRRAPYWYVERLGEAFSGLMDHGAAPAEDRGRHLLARLAATPAYLATAAANLTAGTPPLHVAMGVTAAQGLDRFVARAVPGFAAALPASLQADLAGAVERVRAALADYSARLEALAAVAAGEFACGAEHFDFLLRRFHLLDHDHRSLAEFGAAQMAADRAALERFAAQLDPHTHWAEQVERIKDHHPRGDEFLEVYRAEMMRAREHCVAHDLLTLPAGEAARVNWLPDYLAAGAPLGLMSTTPPFAPGLISELQITPVDRTAPAERQRQHQRDNCYAFARSTWNFRTGALKSAIPSAQHTVDTTGIPASRHASLINRRSLMSISVGSAKMSIVSNPISFVSRIPSAVPTCEPSHAELISPSFISMPLLRSPESSPAGARRATGNKHPPAPSFPNSHGRQSPVRDPPSGCPAILPSSPETHPETTPRSTWASTTRQAAASC